MSRLVSKSHRSLACLVALLAQAPVGRAVAAETEHGAEQVELDYLQGAGCPTKAQFVSEVTARIRRPVTWVVMGGGLHISLALSQAEKQATGRLEVAREGADATRREFTAESCAEVSSALALVVALALDPNARTEALPPSALEPLPAPEVDPAPEEPAVAPPPAAPAPAPVPLAPRAPAPAPAPAPPAAPLRYVAWFGPVGGVSSGYAPEPLVTFGLSLGARLASKTWFAPSLQLTPLWGKTGSTGPAADLGSFAWSMARLEACPVDLRLTPKLGFSPCVAGELGRLAARATASDVAPTSADRWWAAPGVTAALHLDLGSWFVRVSGEAIFPAVRDEFVVRTPDRTVHQASSAAWGGRLGFGFQLGP